LFVASDPGVHSRQLLFTGGHFYAECNWWLWVRKAGISVDFRRVLRFISGFFNLKSYQLEDSMIEEMDLIFESGGIESSLYRRIEDGSLIVVNSIFFRDLIQDGLIEKDIKKLINLCYPCIAAPIRFIFTAGLQELKVLGMSSESESLFKILGARPVWWTPTAKAKAVAGVVLGLRFAHSLVFIHGHVTTNNIIFDLNHRVQITDFLSCLSEDGLSGFSKEGWNPEMDIRGFVSILSEIVINHPAKDEANIPVDVPKFVCEMIKSRFSGEFQRLSSFLNIFKTLKQHDFEIVSGIDTAEVLSSVNWVEALEQCHE
jgi:hypothetical protein